MFGNEMKYGNSKYPNFYQQVNDEVSSIVNDIANGREFSYFKNMMLMSTDVTLPTMVGLPLKMAVNGTANLSFYGTGKMDLSALLSTSPKLSVNAEFYPRASIVFNAESCCLRIAGLVVWNILISTFVIFNIFSNCQDQYIFSFLYLS